MLAAAARRLQRQQRAGGRGRALGLELSLDEVVDRLATAPQVPGRMERIAETALHGSARLRPHARRARASPRDAAAAHTGTAHRGVRLRRRSGQGQAADHGPHRRLSLSDLAIATSDNPRTEDPEAIIDDIEQGMGGAPHLRILDRLAAIHAALNEGQAGDTILLAGKGHETYQVIGTEKDRSTSGKSCRSWCEVSGER